MTKALRIAFAVLAISAAGTASADVINLGAMGPPDIAFFGNDFDTVGDFTDEYTFSVSGSADAFGLAGAWDLSLSRNIDLYSVSLWSNGSALATDTSWGSFSFADLSAGAYSLFVNGTVTGRNGGFLGGGLAGYTGTLVTVASTAPAAVPEPGTNGLLGLALLGLFFALRRKLVR